MKYRAFTKGVDANGMPQTFHVKLRFSEILSVRRASHMHRWSHCSISCTKISNFVLVKFPPCSTELLMYLGIFCGSSLEVLSSLCCKIGKYFQNFFITFTYLHIFCNIYILQKFFITFKNKI